MKGRFLQENKKAIALLTFISIMLFYFFESAQISYFNVLAPEFLSQHIYSHEKIGLLSAIYYYGNVIGLLPIGFMLDHFSLRKTLLWAIFGSVISAFFLFISHQFYVECIARFFCGFFGGAFSFVGGIRIISILFPSKFTFYIGIFLAVGMLAGLICQYPLLYITNHFGISHSMLCIAFFGLLVMIFNMFFLSPIDKKSKDSTKRSLLDYIKETILSFISISKNIKNWLNCFAVILLDTPVSILGTLWGVVIVAGLYHFTTDTSTYIISILFLGLIIGSPTWGLLSDRYNHSPWIVQIGSFLSMLCLLLLIFLKSENFFLIAFLFFALGFFSSTQTVVFTWLTKNMRESKVATNSAFNSIIFMFSGGFIKQVCGFLLTIKSLKVGYSSGMNIITLMFFFMFIIFIYSLNYKKFFMKKNKNE